MARSRPPRFCRWRSPRPEVTGNFPTVTRVLLSKIPPVDGRMTYVYDEHVVSGSPDRAPLRDAAETAPGRRERPLDLVVVPSVLSRAPPPTAARCLVSSTTSSTGGSASCAVSRGIPFARASGRTAAHFAAVSDEHDRLRVPFAFLHDVQTLFAQKYGPDVPHRAIAFSLNEEFAPVIRSRMDHYNSAGAHVDGLSAVRDQIEDVKGHMVENIERVLERGEKIELLVDKTDRLNQQAFKFESSSRELQRAMWWKNARWAAFLTAAGGFAVFFVAGLVCGFDFHRCKAHG